MQVSYEPWLVLLSIAVAIAGGYVGLHLAVQTAAAAGAQRRLLLAGAAFALGAAIWTAHFLGMLAARLPFPTTYLAFPTLLCFLICVLMAGVAVHAVAFGPVTPARLTLSSCVLGAAIFALHSIGMTALAANASVTEAPALVLAGLLIAIAAGALSLRLALRRAGRQPLLLAATAFAVAVTALHFTALAGAAFAPQAAALPGALTLSHDVLAIVLAVAAFGLVSLFLLLLAPDRAETTAELLQVGLAPTYSESGVAAAATAVGAIGSGNDADLRRGIYAPLGGAGAPPPRIADHLPVERDGATQFVPVEDVVAVQANAHYTFLFDGRAKLFCPLAIGEVESRLDRGRFMRVHRSHIVNIERVIGFKRAGDSEVVELAADERYTVPVSRSRAGWLKSRVGVKNGASGRTK